jgi:mono/diheme cytochrome c family protein
VIVALTRAQEFGLAAVAVVFIAFALVSSFVLPARNRDFPGDRGLPAFVAFTVALFLAMMGAVWFLAREDEEEGHAAEPSATETQGDTGATETPAGGTETDVSGRGDVAAGEDVFASAGCAGCHTLEEAGSSGTVGPNLDETQLSEEEIADKVRDGGGGMPSFDDQLDDAEIDDVAAFVAQSASN